MAELLVATEPARKLRGPVVMAVIFAAATALAWGYVSQQSAEQLGKRVGASEFGASFQPPKRFAAGDLVSTPLGLAYPFHFKTPSGEAVLAFRRLGFSPTERVSDVCLRILSYRATVWLRPWIRPKYEASERALGNIMGVEMIDPRTSTIIRAAVPDPSKRIVYALTMTVHGGDMEPELYRVFELSCQSVQFDDR